MSSLALAPVAQSHSENLTSLTVSGGRDFSSGNPRSWQNPDLWVKGGAIIDKSLSVAGNIGVNQFFIGNVIADVVVLSSIDEKFLGEGIDVYGDVRFHGNIVINSIEELNVGGGIDVYGDTRFHGDIIGDDIFVNSISEGNFNQGIDIFGDVRFHGNIIGGNISVLGGNIVINSIEEENVGDGIDVYGDTRFHGNVLTNVIEERTPNGGIDMFGEVRFHDRVLLDTIQEQSPNQGIDIVGDVRFQGNITSDRVQTNFIEEKVINGGIDVLGDVRFHGNIVSDRIFTSVIEEQFSNAGIDFFGNMRFHGNVDGVVLPDVGPGVTTVGDATNVARVTLDSKGRVTGLVAVPITSGGSGTVTSITANSPLTGGTITTTGSIGLGTVGVANGGTALTTYTSGDTIFASATNTLSKLPIGTTGQVLQVSAGGIPVWVTPSGGGGGTVTSITAGSGLSGGTITTSGTIALANTAVTPGNYGSNNTTGNFTVNQQGQITAASTVNIDHNQLTNFTTNAHIDHSSVSISAGNGLTGGGNITTSRTLALSNNCQSVGTIQFAGVQSFQGNGSSFYLSQFGGGGSGQITSKSYNILASAQILQNATTTIYTHSLTPYSTYMVTCHGTFGNVAFNQACGGHYQTVTYGRGGTNAAQLSGFGDNVTGFWSGGQFSINAGTSGNNVLWTVTNNNFTAIWATLNLVVVEMFYTP